MLFNFGTNTDFSVAETCFLSLTTLAKYQCFEESMKYCDIAIKYTALGLSFTQRGAFPYLTFYHSYMTDVDH